MLTEEDMAHGAYLTAFILGYPLQEAAENLNRRELGEEMRYWERLSTVWLEKWRDDKAPRWLWEMAHDNYVTLRSLWRRHR